MKLFRPLRALLGACASLLTTLGAASAQSTNTAPSAAAPAPLRVACAGDSITYGAGCNPRATQSYPAQLAALLGSGYEVRNFGVNGRALCRSVDSYNFDPAYDFNPDLLIVSLGTNDTKAQCWAHKASFVADYVAQLSRFRERNPKLRLFVGLPPPSFYKRWDIDNDTLVNEVLPSIREVAAQTGATLIDFYTLLQNDGDHFGWDKIHPDNFASGKMAQLVFETITAQ